MAPFIACIIPLRGGLDGSGEYRATLPVVALMMTNLICYLPIQKELVR